MPITIADVDDRIRRAFAAERNHQQRLLNDFADQLRDDLEKIVLSLTAELAKARWVRCASRRCVRRIEYCCGSARRMGRMGKVAPCSPRQ